MVPRNVFYELGTFFENLKYLEETLIAIFMFCTLFAVQQ